MDNQEERCFDYKVKGDLYEKIHCFYVGAFDYTFLFHRDVSVCNRNN